MGAASSRSPALGAASWLSPLLVVALVFFAIAVRALGFEVVLFDANVIFPIADPQYHVRRAFYTFVNFPQILLFDPYINHPGGAPVPWPPLYDFVTGGVAHLLFSGRYGFEIVMAWASPLIGALGVIPVYLIGRRLDSRALGLLSALIYALLRQGVVYSRIGYADHHAAVGTIGAWLLYACLRALTSERESRDGARVVGLMVVVRLTLLLTWHGSLLYLALFESSMLIAAVVGRRTRLPRLQFVSAAVTLMCLIPIVAVMPTPLGGSHSAIALSWLHVLALTGVLLLSGGLVALDRFWSGGTSARRAGLISALSATYLGALLLVPAVREGLLPALQFLTLTDAAGQYTLEQMPLYEFLGRSTGPSATFSWGLFAYLIPIAPGAVLLLEASRPGDPRRAGVLLLAAWGAFFGYLAVFQLRYANDFGPAASLLMGAALLAVGRRLATRSRHQAVVGGITLSLFVLLYWVPLTEFYLPLARNSWAAIRGQPNPLARTSVPATLTFFAREIRRLTPETSGYIDEGEPAYGIIAHPNLGHALHNVARRATATDPFWSYIGEQNWARSMAFLESTNEEHALQLAEQLAARYVVTSASDSGRDLMGQLHQHDGSGVDNAPALAHFRLLAEAPAAGRPMSDLFERPSRNSIPYKLFEIVPGAVLEIQAEVGQQVRVSLAIATAQGRHFHYRALAVTDDAGWASLTLPYATSRGSAARSATSMRPGAWATGPYEVSVGERKERVQISESAVRHAERIRVSIE